MYRFGVYPKLNTFPTQTNRRHLNRMLPTNHPPVVPLGKTHCPNHNKASLWFFRLESVDQFQFVVCLEYQGGRFRRAFLERSEEHTSELQSRGHLVCRLLLEKKKSDNRTNTTEHSSKV